MIRTLKIEQLLGYVYEHVGGHQDRIKLWKNLTLEEQLNVKCNELVKSMVHCSILDEAQVTRGVQLLTLENVAVLVDNTKLMTDVSTEVRYCLGEMEARKFYTTQIQKRGGD